MARRRHHDEEECSNRHDADARHRIHHAYLLHCNYFVR